MQKLTKEEFMKVFNCNNLQLGKWIHEGLPHEKFAAPGKKRIYKLYFDKEQCHKWFRGEI